MDAEKRCNHKCHAFGLISTLPIKAALADRKKVVRLDPFPWAGAGAGAVQGQVAGAWAGAVQG